MTRPTVRPSKRSSLSTRPYVLTGGRTVPAIGVRSDMLVWKADRYRESSGAVSGLGAAFEGLLDACHEPTTVAEIALALGLPVQIVKVMVADLLLAGLAESEDPIGQRPDVVLLGQVLDGLARSL